VSGPNPFSVLGSMVRSRRLSAPRPTGTEVVDHQGFAGVLEAVAGGGITALGSVQENLDDYIGFLQTVDPNAVDRDEALAFWLNLYNALALDVARRADAAIEPSVLGVRRGFTAPIVTVAGEALALDGIEHGKTRRFGDPRIHAGLVCGAVSCPTLRFEPFSGSRLDAQLDDQMRSFLRSGGFLIDRQRNRISVSRIFRWYGGDFVAPHRMPTLWPASRRRILASLHTWLEPDDSAWIQESHPKLEFQNYDWALGCSVTKRPETA
jgi:hypothetical protein